MSSFSHARYGDDGNQEMNPNIKGAYKSPLIIAQSAVPINLTGTTALITLVGIVIPGNTMGRNGSLRVTTLWSCTNSANNKSITPKLGAASICPIVLTASATLQQMALVRNRGVTNSQVGFTSSNWTLGASSAGVVVSAIDTSVDQILTLNAQLALGSETITLEGYIVEVLPGA